MMQLYMPDHELLSMCLYMLNYNPELFGVGLNYSGAITTPVM